MILFIPFNKNIILNILLFTLYNYINLKSFFVLYMYLFINKHIKYYFI